MTQAFEFASKELLSNHFNLHHISMVLDAPSLKGLLFLNHLEVLVAALLLLHASTFLFRSVAFSCRSSASAHKHIYMCLYPHTHTHTE
eukprot:c24675_g4_i1 orf=3-263(-)